MCLLCQHKQLDQMSVLQEIFHEMELATPSIRSRPEQIHHKSRRERRAAFIRSGTQKSILREVLESL